MGMNASRAGREQSLFREINERIRSIAADQSTSFLCECANLDCIETIELPLAEYERVRLVATHFVVRPGHVLGEVERVVASGDGYVVVEKFGAAALDAASEARGRAKEPRR